MAPAPPSAELFARISWRLLPIIGISYVIAFIDRGNIAYASVTMNVDLGFSQAVYGFGAGLFFLAYALFEVPSNLLCERFGPRRWLARIMASWGLVSIAMAFVTTPETFYLLRFLLGMAEAGFFPGVILYLSYWYPSRQRVQAVSRFYIGLPIAGVASGLLAGPLLALDGAQGLAGWQWLLLLEGLPALAMAPLVLWLLPDRPDRVGWLSDDEKAWLNGRLASDAAEAGTRHGGLLRTLVHPLVLATGCGMGLNFMIISALSFSGPKLMAQAMGWPVAQAGTFFACVNLAVIPAMLALAPFVDRADRPFRLVSGLFLVVAVGATLLSVDRLGYGAPAGYLVVWVAGQCAGMLHCALVVRYMPPPARAAAAAAVNTLAQTGNFAGATLFGIAADRTGSFLLGLSMMVPIAIAAAGIVMLSDRWQRGSARRAAPA